VLFVPLLLHTIIMHYLAGFRSVAASYNNNALSSRVTLFRDGVRFLCYLSIADSLWTAAGMVLGDGVDDMI